MAKEKIETRALSIFRATLFGSWVVTHSLEIDDFHAHLAAVLIKQRLLSIWLSLEFVGKIQHFSSKANGLSHFVCSAYQNTTHLYISFKKNPTFVRKEGILHI